MRYLLDTHAFLWWILDDARIPANAAGVIHDIENDILVSAASCWEIAIKSSLGKLHLPSKAESFIPDQLAVNALTTLPVLASHALHLGDLPMHHRDPFDRMIVAQARLEDIPIITSDTEFDAYDVTTIWA